MKAKKNHKSYFLTLILLCLTAINTRTLSAGVDSSTSSGLAVHAERALKISGEYIDFLNSSITNLGNEEQRVLYKKIVENDLRARIYLRQYQFSRSYKSSRVVQLDLINLFRILLVVYISEGKNLLHNFAPEIIISEDGKALHYLRLGYRAIAVAEELSLKGDYTRPFHFYNTRLQQYRKAIVEIKRGRRFAFLAFLYVKTATADERRIEGLTFYEMKRALDEMLNENKPRLMAMHFDNFGKLSGESLQDKYFYGDEKQLNSRQDTLLNTPTAR